MSRGYHFLERLVNEGDIPAETLPGIPIVEIAGDHRVLIENHLGVNAYSCERIGVNVKFGQVWVCGAGLELIRMTKEQLVICGRIDGISLCRREYR